MSPAFTQINTYTYSNVVTTHYYGVLCDEIDTVHCRMAIVTQMQHCVVLC